MTPPPAKQLQRGDIYPAPQIDGHPVRTGPLGRARRRVERALVSRGERVEADIDARILTAPGVTSPNVVAVVSPKGGVGKTTSTYVVGNLLAAYGKLRVIAVDANPDFGTLAALVPDHARTERSLADLLEDAPGLKTAAHLRPYVSRLPTGLHVLSSPADAALSASLDSDRYGELLAFLSVFYEVVLLDLGTGVAGPLAGFAIERAHQVVLVTTPEWVTSTVVLSALSHLQHDRTTVALNKCPANDDRLRVFEDRFRAEHLHRAVSLPYDERFGTMLDTGTYALAGLDRPTRLAIKRLGLAVAEQLV